MKWREFITLLGGTAATLPIVARAQQPTMPVIGYLSAGSAESFAENLAIFQRSVAEAGYVEGQNVARISLVERSSRPPAGTGGRYVCFRGKRWGNRPAACGWLKILGAALQADG